MHTLNHCRRCVTVFAAGCMLQRHQGRQGGVHQHAAHQLHRHVLGERLLHAQRLPGATTPAWPGRMLRPDDGHLRQWQEAVRVRPAHQPVARKRHVWRRRLLHRRLLHERHPCLLSDHQGGMLCCGHQLRPLQELRGDVPSGEPAWLLGRHAPRLGQAVPRPHMHPPDNVTRLLHPPPLLS